MVGRQLRTKATTQVDTGELTRLEKGTVSVASDGSKLTLTGVAEGTATVTVTARASDGNEVSDDFDVTVAAARQPEKDYSDLIAQMKEWRNDPNHVSSKEHTDRRDRALLAFGETVADTSLTPMTVAEAQTYVDRGGIAGWRLPRRCGRPRAANAWDSLL